jgi:DNA invertase Pin-like site-specific DNA recombinase
MNDSWADTTTAHGRLMLVVLAGLAEFERELIRARTSEGRERARARGVKLGRKFKLTPHQQWEARARRVRDLRTRHHSGRITLVLFRT